MDRDLRSVRITQVCGEYLRAVYVILLIRENHAISREPKVFAGGFDLGFLRVNDLTCHVSHA